MATSAVIKKAKKVTPKKVVAKAKTAAKTAAKDVSKKGRNLAGILSAILVPVATVAIGYGLTRYYGINVPTKMMSLMK